MKLNINDKEYSIKFGYKPTLKSRITTRLLKMSNRLNDSKEDTVESFVKIEDMLLFLPELLLVGLQKYHREEFEYDYDSENGKLEAYDKACDLIDDYLDIEENSPMDLYNDLQHELLHNSFLSKMFGEELDEEKIEEMENREAVVATPEQTES